MSIVPKPDVIEPELRAPVVVKLESESISDSINVTTLDNAAFLFVPSAPSSTIIRSEVVNAAQYQFTINI